MVPDQVGGARRPVCTVPADGIIGLGHGVMHIRSGVADVVSVEAHSKVADVLEKTRVENLALDPQFHRVTGANSDVLAGLEMSSFMKSVGFDRDDISLVVKTEKEKATKNSRASYGAMLGLPEIGEAQAIVAPLRRYDRSEYAEAGVVLVLASERWIKRNTREAVFIDGLAWRSSTPWFEGGSVESARYAKDSFDSVKKQARIRSLEDFDIMEVDDTYSYKLLQHLLSLGVSKSSAVKMVEEKTRRLNPSGGSLGTGYLIEANGSHKVLECVLQMRGQAGGNQVKKAKRALAVSWRGNPTATGAAVALSGVG
jgi:acetyl-CoA C-acetyltransferase